MMNKRDGLARASSTWQQAWLGITPTFQEQLTRLKLDSPVLWAGLADSDEAVEIFTLLDNLSLLTDLPAATQTQRVDEARALWRAAQGPGSAYARSEGRKSDLQVSADLLSLASSKRRATEEGDLRKAAAHSLALLPAAWSAKRYRRREQGKNPRAREEAEDQERTRWAKEVLGLLLEANLPFTATALETRSGVTGPAALRCCRGQRPNSLKQRVSCWRPFRRWLLAEGLPPFPETAAQTLDYLELAFQGGAARSFYSSFLGALSFFEVAGERREEDSLHKHPGVRSACKELEATTARTAKEGRPKPRGQAPPLLLAQLLALERVVADEATPLYARGYAWVRLLRHWASLRWDDTLGIPPATLELRARGLFCLLEMSKTSGPEKTVRVLPVFVSREAYLEVRWLETGFKLWAPGGPLHFERDYLVALPAPNWEEVLNFRAVYTDACSLSKALLGRLPQKTGEVLLLPETCNFWTEHKDRAGCTGWIAAIGVDSETRGFLGRWAIKSSADNYVRTAPRVVENLQLLATRFARRALSGGPDYFGEEDTLIRLRNFLGLRGFAVPEIDWQLEALTEANPKLAITLPTLSPEELMRGAAEGTNLDKEARDASASETESGGPSGDETPTKDRHTVAADQARQCLEPDTEATPDSFVVSITKGGFRRLHFVGACRLVPGEDYRHFEVYGELLPPAGAFNARCQWCFQDGGAAHEDDLPSNSSSSSSSSSSASERET